MRYGRHFLSLHEAKELAILKPLAVESVTSFASSATFSTVKDAVNGLWMEKSVSRVHVKAEVECLIVITNGIVPGFMNERTGNACSSAVETNIRDQDDFSQPL